MNLAERLSAGGDRAAMALVADDRRRSYGELADRVARLARRIAEAAAPGDRVSLVIGNEIEFVDAYLATLHAGAVVHPIEPSAPSAEQTREVEVTKPALVISTPHTQRLGATAAEHVGAAHLVLDDGLDLGADAPLPIVERQADDLAALLFTSGTAGAPKAAMLTHGSLAANLDQARAVPDVALRSDDVALGALPFFHVYGLNVVIGWSLDAGASLVVVRHFAPGDALEIVRTNGVTVLPAVPAMYAAWLALDGAPADAFRSVRRAASGATFLPVDVLEGMRARFGVEVHEGYGLTEASPVVTSSARDGAARPGSVGWALPGVEVRLVDLDGADALQGDPGEIWVRGPNVFAGYWNEPEATARVLVDGWLRTGDVAVADDDGSLRLVDRMKDLVIVSGFNVFPAEVEEAIDLLPGVVESAVVGVPDGRSGEAIEAYVVVAGDARLDEAAVQRGVAHRLARYKVPRAVHFVDALPHTFGGKLARRALRSD